MVIGVLTSSSFNSSMSPEKTDRYWKMTIVYHKLNQIIDVGAVNVPDVVSLLEQINPSPGTQYAFTDLAIFFPQYLLVEITRSNLFLAGKVSSMPLLSHSDVYQLSSPMS